VSIRKHTLYNLIGYALPLGLSLVTIPIYIHLIGESRYGVLAMAWLLLGYFGLFDLGLGRATAQHIAALADGSAAERAQTFWTALVMNGGLGVVGGLIIWPAALYFFGRIFSIEQVLRPELNAAIPWLLLAVPLATLSGVLTGALQGRAQFLELNVISVFSAVLTQLFPLAVALFHGPDLSWLLPAVILARLITMSALFLRCRFHVFSGQPRSISRSLAKGLLQFGGWVTVTSLVSPMMEFFDRFIIGTVMGAKAVTYYSVPYQLAARTNNLSNAMSTALFPRWAGANVHDEKNLSALATRTLVAIMTPIIVAGIFLMKPFLALWIDSDFSAHAAVTGQLLLVGFFFNACALMPYARLQATGRPHLVARAHLIEALPYFGLLYIGLHYFGLEGAATVFGLRTFADCLILMFFAGDLREGVLLMRVPVLLLLCSLAVASRTVAWSGVCLMSTTAIFSVTAWWAWRNAPPELRRFLPAIRAKDKLKSTL
jgi:O-antigen/teichoic acid export membrane protein